MTNQPSFEDVLGCQTALFEWAESYDTKDWDRLAKCVAPTVRIDYRAFLNKLWEAMPVDDFVKMASDPHVLGNPKVKTQHFIGAQKWTKISDDEMIAKHQMRVAHQKYRDEKFTEVALKGHGYGACTTTFRKIDGVWKWAGLTPEIRWHEYDLDKIFHEGEEKFGEKE
ncbi:Scytalone dehydratase [Talaromyces pinophilus]|nr:Scytalone dehydratase [Talaromyces pinophilus]